MSQNCDLKFCAWIKQCLEPRVKTNIVSTLPMKSQGFLFITIYNFLFCIWPVLFCVVVNPFLSLLMLIAVLTAEHGPADIFNESSLQTHMYKDKPGKRNLTFIKAKQSIRVRGRWRVFYQMGKNKNNQKRHFFPDYGRICNKKYRESWRGNYIDGITPSALLCIIS